MATFYRRTGKRIFDVLGAAAALACLWPVLLLTALGVRVALGSPVLFRQQRPGLGGRVFEILKFRTMLDARAPDGTPLPDAARMTAFGRFLRGSSLDELPELWNVVRGDMSLVGPRPLLIQYLPRYTARQASRHNVRPGVTGLAQVTGRNALSWEEKFDMDVHYVEHHTFGMDLRILLRTLSSVIRRKGISHDGHATAPEFMGSSTDQ
jgi:sugar transferase EpsL